MQFYASGASMDRGCRLFQQLATSRHPPAFADEPHGGPERRRRAGHDRQAMTVLERLGDAERAQASAGDQNAFGLRRLRHRLAAERDDVGLAFAARPAELEDVETFKRRGLD